MTDPVTSRTREGEAGFTLIEAMIAMVILIFGIASVANLMVVAGTSNTAGNHSTAATVAATEQLELLKAVPYGTLVPGGGPDLNADVGPTGACGALPVGTYNCDLVVRGVGTIHVRWRIVDMPAAADMRFIEVRAESRAPAMGLRSRAWFTTYRMA